MNYTIEQIKEKIVKYKSLIPYTSSAQERIFYFKELNKWKAELAKLMEKQG